MKLNLAIATSKVIDAKYPKIKKKEQRGNSHYCIKILYTS